MNALLNAVFIPVIAPSVSREKSHSKVQVAIPRAAARSKTKP
jgi:hypothetical protein